MTERGSWVKRRLYFQGNPAGAGAEAALRTADGAEPVALSVVLTDALRAQLPARPPLPPLNVGARGPSLENCCGFACCRREHRALKAWLRRLRKVPRKQRFLVSGLGVQKPEGCLPLCSEKSAGAAGSHWRLKADNRARSCGGSDSCWETSPGPNTPQLWSVGGLSVGSLHRRKVPCQLQKRTCNSLKING